MAALEVETPLYLRLGKAAGKKFEQAGLETVGDLLNHSPRRYYSWGRLTDIAALEVGEQATVLAQVVDQNLVWNRSGKGVRLMVDITDGTSRLTCTFFAKNPYMLNHHKRLLKPGNTVLFGGKVSEYRGKKQLVQPEFEELDETSPELAARRAGRPIPIYPAVANLPSWRIGAAISSILDELAEGAVAEPVPEQVRRQHGLLTQQQAYRGLHQPESPADHQAARRSLAWAEALTLQTALLSSRVAAEGKDARTAPELLVEGEDAEGLLARLLDGLPFELTEGQKGAWEEIRRDLTHDQPMQRLLQADVGAGKTVVALLAMVAAVQSGHQAALLAPTEVLARQHYRSLLQLLAGAGIDIPVHILTGKTPAAARQAALVPLAAGEPGIVVGTHALLQEGVDLPDLALLVVDEQHRFGVAQREALREGRALVPHLLVMTATPIPRTIAMTIFGDLDVTTMMGLPPGRQPVATTVVNAHNQVWMDRIWKRAKEEVDSGGRVYVVCPNIDPREGEEAPEPGLLPIPTEASSERSPSVKAVAEELRGKEALKGVSIVTAHGQASAEENTAAFESFKAGDTPLLVATTVIEVGVDVPEATMMVILGADRFGLSQLHQLRGRVGRSDRESICLVSATPTDNPLTTERLETLASTTDGFVLAEADLRLRREGDVVGQSQSGRSSGLQFLSVLGDGEIISAARACAAQLLEVDPTLAAHPDLAQSVAKRTGQDLVWLERN